MARGVWRHRGSCSFDVEGVVSGALVAAQAEKERAVVRFVEAVRSDRAQLAHVKGVLDEAIGVVRD